MMTLAEQRIKIIKDEAKKPITPQIAMENLIRCGILTPDGEVAEPYKDVIAIKRNDTI